MLIKFIATHTPLCKPPTARGPCLIHSLNFVITLTTVREGCGRRRGWRVTGKDTHTPPTPIGCAIAIPGIPGIRGSWGCSVEWINWLLTGSLNAAFNLALTSWGWGWRIVVLEWALRCVQQAGRGQPCLLSNCVRCWPRAKVNTSNWMPQMKQRTTLASLPACPRPLQLPIPLPLLLPLPLPSKANFGSSFKFTEKLHK